MWPDSVFLHVCVCVTVSKLYPEIRQIENLTLGQDITRHTLYRPYPYVTAQISGPTLPLFEFRPL